MLIMKRIVIMGASSGIGLRVAEAFASRGVKVGMAARHTESMRELKKQYSDMIEYESIDVTHTNAPNLWKTDRETRRNGHLLPCGGNRI